MITKLVGVKEFRQNISGLYKEAIKNKIQYIVLNRNQPIFKVMPLSEKDIVMEKLVQNIEEARDDIKKGRLYNFEEVCNELGL